MMDVLVTEKLWDLLLISLTFSIFLMALIQKIKSLEEVRKPWQVLLMNVFFSFTMGIPFGMEFFALPLDQAVWIGVFGFIGAPSIYEVLKKQNIINYNPKTTKKDYVCVPMNNEIPR